MLLFTAEYILYCAAIKNYFNQLQSSTEQDKAFLIKAMIKTVFYNCLYTLEHLTFGFSNNIKKKTFIKSYLQFDVI